MTTGTPALSVVLVTPNAFSTIRKTVRHLRAQSIHERIELLVVVPSRVTLDAPPAELEGFARWEVIELGETNNIARMKLEAVRRATAPVVVFAEDHCFPTPTWGAALLAAHDAGWEAVGPVVSNGNPGTRLSQAAFLLHWLSWTGPLPAGETHYLPWHNTSYRRRDLLALGERLSELLPVEGFLQDELRASGSRFYLEPAACATHINMSRLRPWIGHGYWGGRMYAAFRSARWPLPQRLLRVMGAPLVPGVRLLRILRDVRRSDELRALVPGVLPCLVLGLVIHAVGEVAGYLVGPGPSEEHYSWYEMNRASHVTDAERSALAA